MTNTALSAEWKAGVIYSTKFLQHNFLNGGLYAKA